MYISYDLQNWTQYLPHIPRANGPCVLPEVQAGHPQGRRASRGLRVRSARAIHAFIALRFLHIDSAMARAILKVYKSASSVPAEPSVDHASVTRVRNSITSSSEGSSSSSVLEYK